MSYDQEYPLGLGQRKRSHQNRYNEHQQQRHVVVPMLHVGGCDFGGKQSTIKSKRNRQQQPQQQQLWSINYLIVTGTIMIFLQLFSMPCEAFHFLTRRTTIKFKQQQHQPFQLRNHNHNILLATRHPNSGNDRTTIRRQKQKQHQNTVLFQSPRSTTTTTTTTTSDTISLVDSSSTTSRNPLPVNGTSTTTATLLFTAPSSLDQQSSVSSLSSSPALTTVTTTDTAKTTQLTISLIKSLVGSGTLALPAGVVTLMGTAHWMGGSTSTIVDHFAPESLPMILLPTLFVITMVGSIYGYFFQLIGRVCQITNSTSYKEAWDNTMNMNDDDSNDENQNENKTTNKNQFLTLLVTLCIIIKPGLGCLAYSMILADSFQSLGTTIGFGEFMTRDVALLGITITTLLPLCLMESITALTPYSLLGLLCIGFTTIVMVLRYFDHSYLLGSMYTNEMSSNLQPYFGDGTISTSSVLTDLPINQVVMDSITTTAASSSSTDVVINTMGDMGVVLACTLATAFVAHYNSPRFFNELIMTPPPPQQQQSSDVVLYENQSGNNVMVRSSNDSQTNPMDQLEQLQQQQQLVSSTLRSSQIQQYQRIVITAFGIAGLLYSTVAIMGYLTFGYHSQGFILNNYSPYDPLVIASRITLAISITLTYPLPFVGLRDGIRDLLKQFIVSSDDQQQLSTTETTTQLEIQTEQKVLPSMISNNNNDTASHTIPIRFMEFLLSDSRYLSVGILFVVTILASMIHDLQFVLAVGGATFSTAVATIFPTLMYRSMINNKKYNQQQYNTIITDQDRREVYFALLLMCCSIGLGIAGVTIAIQNAFP